MGFHAPAWTTGLLQQYIRKEFEIEYSRPSGRRLMKEAGLSYQTPGKAAAEAHTQDRDELEQELTKLGHVWIPD